jgi:putative two-component system response regulator
MSPRTDTVLIVDDQAENLAILGDLLEPHYRIRVADSGERALKAAASDPRPDLILLDVMMPDLDGYAVLSRLRANAATRDIPVIFVTARDAAEDEERGFVLGAVDYIVKPIKPLVVLARVRTHLENKRARDWLADQNKFLESEIVHRMHDNEIVQSASLAALAILAEVRDTDTGNHIYRTQGYVDVLARALANRPEYAEALTADQLSKLVKAAPLHDLGKVGVPDKILLKPGALSEEEFAIMRGHTIIGSDAIARAMAQVQAADSSIYRSDSRPLAFLEVARCIARSHHERWDGRGYPDGTAGPDTPLAARIMALADVFDALISRRVYKAPMSIEQATEIIVSERGKHFDPDIVDAFFQEKEQFVRIAQRFADT